MSIAHSAASRLVHAMPVVALLLVTAWSHHAAGQTVVDVIEYHNAALDHYFITADPGEIALLDGGGLGGAWRRTGEKFRAWSTGDGPEGAVPVCRFFGTDQYRADGTRIGADSHFYTADPNECAYVRTAWPSVAASGQSYPAWTFESNAFRVNLPSPGAIATANVPGDAFRVNLPSRAVTATTANVPVYRAYNNGARGNPNHRYSTSPTLLSEMQGWTQEGVVMVVPGQGNPGPDSGQCMIPEPGHSTELSGGDVIQLHETSGSPAAPLVKVTTVVGSAAGGGRIVEERPYQVLPGPGTRTILRLPTAKRTMQVESITMVEEVQENQQLILPMNPGDSQFAAGPLTGTYTVSGPVSCTAEITGQLSWQWTYIGIEAVTVPGGTYNACRFAYVRRALMSVTQTCGPGVGFGSGAGSGDPVAMWFVPGIGIIKTAGEQVLQMVNYH